MCTPWYSATDLLVLLGRRANLDQYVLCMVFSSQNKLLIWGTTVLLLLFILLATKYILISKSNYYVQVAKIHCFVTNKILLTPLAGDSMNWPNSPQQYRTPILKSEDYSLLSYLRLKFIARSQSSHWSVKCYTISNSEIGGPKWTCHPGLDGARTASKTK